MAFSRFWKWTVERFYKQLKLIMLKILKQSPKTFEGIMRHERQLQDSRYTRDSCETGFRLTLRFARHLTVRFARHLALRFARPDLVSRFNLRDRVSSCTSVCETEFQFAFWFARPGLISHFNLWDWVSSRFLVCKTGSRLALQFPRPGLIALQFTRWDRISSRRSQRYHYWFRSEGLNTIKYRHLIFNIVQCPARFDEASLVFSLVHRLVSSDKVWIPMSHVRAAGHHKLHRIGWSARWRISSYKRYALLAVGLVVASNVPFPFRIGGEGCSWVQEISFISVVSPLLKLRLRPPSLVPRSN